MIVRRTEKRKKLSKHVEPKFGARHDHRLPVFECSIPSTERRPRRYSKKALPIVLQVMCVHVLLCAHDLWSLSCPHADRLREERTHRVRKTADVTEKRHFRTVVHSNILLVNTVVCPYHERRAVWDTIDIFRTHLIERCVQCFYHHQPVA